MAEIFNQKEEVISIELTTYGRKQLSLGLYKPEYFSFFDDSIIYDNNYAKINEDVNHIQKRILDQSLTLKALNLTEDKLREKLGSSNTLNEYAPAWHLDVLHNQINYKQPISSYYKKRFTINNMAYIFIEKEEEMPEVKTDYLLIDLQELNVSDDISNFEIEVFAYDEQTFTYDENFTTEEIALFDSRLGRRLLFSQKRNNIVDDILYEENELPTNFFSVKIDHEDILYYFDVLVDEEIDLEFISSKEKTIKDSLKGVYQSDYTGPTVPCP